MRQWRAAHYTAPPSPRRTMAVHIFLCTAGSSDRASEHTGTTLPTDLGTRTWTAALDPGHAPIESGLKSGCQVRPSAGLLHGLRGGGQSPCPTPAACFPLMVPVALIDSISVLGRSYPICCRKASRPVRSVRHDPTLHCAQSRPVVQNAISSDLCGALVAAAFKNELRPPIHSKLPPISRNG